MYRPKEPENRRPASYAASTGQGTGMPYRGSLLDRLNDDRFETGKRIEDERDDDHDEYWRRPTPRQPAPDRFEEPEKPEKSSLDGIIEAQVRSLSEITPGDILSWLRGGLRWIIVMTVIGVIAAFLYSATATPRYTVYTDLIIDPQNLNVVNDDVFASNPQRDSQLLEVESRLRVLTSRNVLMQVIRDMKLTEDPEFTKPNLLAPLYRLISGNRPAGDKELGVLMELGDRVKAGREERSFVVTLSVWTSDPEKSVGLSEAIVRAFEAELFESSADSAGRVAATLTGRLDELRAAVTDAEEKVAQFRRDNNIQESNTGELASTRISSALDTQVLDAQQKLIQAEARYNQMRSAVADRRTVTATVFDSPSMETLRASYNTLQQQIGSLTLTYGARHPRLISMQSEKTALEKAIADEANRILQNARTDVDEARSTLSQLRSKADAERSTVFTNNDAQVRLRELERDARAKAAVYETYLGRTHQITERQQIDTSNVRVISPPVPPKTKSWPPRTLILLVAGAIGGFMAGTGLALVLGLWGHLGDARERFAYTQRYALRG